MQTRVLIDVLAEAGPYGTEYTSVWLYGTDFLIGALLVTWLFSVRKNFARSLSFLKNWLGSPLFWLTLFVSWSLISAVLSSYPALGLYKTVKLGEFIIVFLMLGYGLRKEFLRSFLWGLVIGGLGQALLMGGQFALQHDLGLKFLGESPLGVDQAGVAKVDLAQGKVIRAYGTTPHPNIAGTYLVAALSAGLLLIITGALSRRSRWLLLGFVPVLVFGIGFSFSRLAVLETGLVVVGLLVLGLLIKLKEKRELVGGLLISIVLASFVFALLFKDVITERLILRPDEQAVSLRYQYARAAGELIAERPAFGLGPGQFVINVESKLKQLLPTRSIPAWMVQPAHNVYLLIASETGIIGLILFLGFLVALLAAAGFGFSAQALLIIFLLIGFLLAAFFDHFFWTLQQGQILWWAVLGLVWRARTRLIPR